MQLHSDSFCYHCIIHQSKPHLPYLLMLHGFMGSGRVFDHLIVDLSTFCNPITIDLAGHGKTESPDDPKFYTADRQVKQLYSIIQRLQFDDLYLYGYSMGGRLAFHLLASYLNLFSGAFIESSHCGINSESARSERKKIDEKRAQKIEQNFNDFIIEWMKMPLFQHTTKEMKSIYKKVMKAQNPKQICASLRGFGTGVMPSVCDQISGLSFPFTLIAGELDQKYVKMMSLIHEKIDGSNLQIVRNAGHRVHADQPGDFVDILKNAMSRN